MKLMQLGYYEDFVYSAIRTGWYHLGISGRAIIGEMFAVPQGIEEREMYEIHGILR